MTFLKAHWVAILVLILFLWVIFKPAGCGPNIGGHGGTDTVKVVTETKYVPQPPVYIPTYVPTQSGSQKPIIIPPSYNPSADYASLVKQYNDLVNKYLATNTYNDSIHLKDSTGHDVGVVNLVDMVSENQIKARKPSYQLNFPHTTTTITVLAPPKNQVFIGGGIAGTSLPPYLTGVDAGLAIKNKRDRIYEFNGGFRTFDGKFYPHFEVKTYWKIKLGK